MKPEIKYVELKSDSNNHGSAWIGLVSFSKSGKTIYFNNKAYQSLNGSGISGNYMDVKTGDEYWISSPKKNLKDRHYTGGGIIFVERRILADYLRIINRTELPKKGYVLVDVDTTIPKERINQLENEIFETSEYDADLHYKKPNELSTKELEFLIAELIESEENAMYNKGRRTIKRKRIVLETELEKRLM